MTKVFIETFNSSYNAVDSEYMAALLSRAQFTLATTLAEGDLVILNVRTVRGPSVADVKQRMEWIKKEFPYKEIIIVGCISDTEPEKFKKFTVVGTQQIHHIVEAVEETLHNNIVHLLETDETPPLTLPKIRTNPTIEMIPLERGCLGQCAFCKTKGTGKLRSYPILDIVTAVQTAVKEGVQQIWLTSQDSMAYGRDISTNISSLLKELINLPGDFKIRLDPGNPIDFIAQKQDLIPLLAHPKLFQFLWLSIPTGSNRILTELNLKFTREKLLDALAEVQACVPQFTFAASILAGFPAETDEDHWQTTDLLRKMNPDIVLVSKYHPASKKVKLPPEEIILQRMDRLRGMATNISGIRNEQWLGWKGLLLIEEESKEPGTWIGRTASYKPISVTGNFHPGQLIPVNVTKAGISEIRAEVHV